MEDPNIPPILQSIKPHQWSLGNQLAKYQKQSLGPAKYMDFAKQGISFDEVFKQEHDEIVKQEILENVIPIAEESVKAGVSDEEFARQLDPNAQQMRDLGLPEDLGANMNPRFPQVDIPSQKKEPLKVDMGDLMYTSEGKDPDTAVNEADEYLKRVRTAQAAYDKEATNTPKMPGRSPMQKPDTVEALVTLAAMLVNPGKFSGDIAKSLLDSKVNEQSMATQEALKNFAILDEQHQQALKALSESVDNNMSMWKEKNAEVQKATDDKRAGERDAEIARHNRASEGQADARINQGQQRLDIKVEDNLVKGYTDGELKQVDPAKFTGAELQKRVDEANDKRDELISMGVPPSRLPRPVGVTNALETKGGVEIAKAGEDLKGKIAKNEFDKLALPVRLEILRNQKLHGDAQELFDANKQILDDLAIQKNRIELKFLEPKLREQLNKAVVTRRAAQQKMDAVTKEQVGGKPLSRDGYQQAKTKWQQQITDGKILLLDKDPKTMAESHAIGKMYIEEAQRNIADLDGQMKPATSGTTPVNPLKGGIGIPGFDFMKGK